MHNELIELSLYQDKKKTPGVPHLLPPIYIIDKYYSPRECSLWPGYNIDT